MVPIHVLVVFLIAHAGLVLNAETTLVHLQGHVILGSMLAWVALSEPSPHLREELLVELLLIHDGGIDGCIVDIGSSDLLMRLE